MINGMSLFPNLIPHKLRHYNPLSPETIFLRFSTISSIVTSLVKAFFFGLTSTFLATSFFSGFPFLPSFFFTSPFLFCFGSGLAINGFASLKTFPERSIVLKTIFSERDFVI